MASLHAMTLSYKKRSSVALEWTEELEDQFSLVQKEVPSCQKLFFVDDKPPLPLHTDASCYGIGANLLQVVEGKPNPVRLTSRTLSSRERKWSTCEKKACAIFYALVELEHLVRDRKFLLRAGSRSLAFLNTDKSPKVVRWKLATQHFDFGVQHIKGVGSTEAGAFSRLVHLPTVEEEPLELRDMEVVPDTGESTRLPADVYQALKSVHGGTHGHGGINRAFSLLATAKKK